jgi:undecaprenyl-diphosphatase
VGLGIIPVGLVGISLSDAMQEALRNPLIIAAATIIFALLLWWAEKRASERRHTITLNDALLIGLFQALALVHQKLDLDPANLLALVIRLNAPSWK